MRPSRSVCAPDPGSTSSVLLEELKAKDALAWRQLIDLYGPLVYSWCRKCGLQQTDAADVTQNVFQAAAHAIERFRHERHGDSFRAWLRTIAQNKIRDHFRHARTIPLVDGGTAANDRLEQIAQPGTGQITLSEFSNDREDTHELMRQALNAIRDDFEPKT